MCTDTFLPILHYELDMTWHFSDFFCPPESTVDTWKVYIVLHCAKCKYTKELSNDRIQVLFPPWPVLFGISMKRVDSRNVQLAHCRVGLCLISFTDTSCDHITLCFECASNYCGVWYSCLPLTDPPAFWTNSLFLINILPWWMTLPFM